MSDPLAKTLARTRTRRAARWAALAVGAVLPTVGCQVEYAGMTLPSGRYMHDDVQYFPPGPDFPWANTQAATQRARMQAMGLDLPAPAEGPVALPPPAQGALPPGNANQAGGVPNINNQINQPGAGNVPNVGGAAPGGNVPAPPPPGNGGNDPNGGIPTPDPSDEAAPAGGMPRP